MQQQPGIPTSEDTNGALKIKMAKDAVYVMYRDKWYIVDENTSMCPRTFALFDGVIFVNKKGEFEVAKDRALKLTKQTINELKMYLFAEGKMLTDLPTFRVDDSSKAPNGPLALHTDDKGNLIAFTTLGRDGNEF